VNSGFQFFRLEGFRQVILSATFQALFHAGKVVLAGDKQYRHKIVLTHGFEYAAQFVAVDVGHLDIQ
jgi:hypothetical protein